MRAQREKTRQLLGEVHDHDDGPRRHVGHIVEHDHVDVLTLELADGVGLAFVIIGLLGVRMKHEK